MTIYPGNYVICKHKFAFHFRFVPSRNPMEWVYTFTLRKHWQFAFIIKTTIGSDCLNIHLFFTSLWLCLNCIYKLLYWPPSVTNQRALIRAVCRMCQFDWINHPSMDNTPNDGPFEYEFSMCISDMIAFCHQIDHYINLHMPRQYVHTFVEITQK